MLKESRDNWGQKAGHVGVPTFGGKTWEWSGRRRLR